MMSARRLTQPPGSLAWSWLTSAAGQARPGSSPPASGEDEAGGFPRAAARALPRGGGTAGAGAARAFARATLQRWDITGERRDDIILVLSEMAANALRHTRPAPGRWQVAAGLLQPRPGSGILCAVTDPGPGQPRPCPARQLGESGRGLQVIGALSDQWGYTPPGPAGKVVWAVLGPAAPGFPRRERPLAGREHLPGRLRFWPPQFRETTAPSTFRATLDGIVTWQVIRQLARMIPVTRPLAAEARRIPARSDFP